MGSGIFKITLMGFLGIALWGLISDWSIESILIKATLAALAIYFVIIVYFSFVRVILRSGGEIRRK